MKKIGVLTLAFGVFLTSPAMAFSDVPEGFWAYERITEMNKCGVVSGFEDGTFKPNDVITREQAAAIMTNFFDLTLKSDAKKFEDVEEGYWSEQYVNLAGQYLPVDVEDGKYYFRPFKEAKRIEIAEAITKIIGFNDEDIDETIIEKFTDNLEFSENDKKYITAMVKNNIMSGDDKSQFRPNDTITRAEFCSIIYNVYLMRDGLQAQTLDKTVMTINGEPLTYSKFDLYFKLQKKAYESMFGGSEIWTQEINGVSLYELVKDATKDSLVLNSLKLQKANEMGIELTEGDLEYINEYADSDIGNEICEFYEISPEQFMEINTESLIMDELEKAVYNSLDHSTHNHLDIDALVPVTMYDVRHILLADSGLSDEEKEALKVSAEALLERVKNGEDFAVLATEYSDDTGSKENGGLYEDVEEGEFVSEFEEAALSLDAGMIYPELVESPYGYHIIKLEAKRDATRELTDLEKQDIISADLEIEVQKWLESADIEVNEEIYKSL